MNSLKTTIIGTILSFLLPLNSISVSAPGIQPSEKKSGLELTATTIAMLTGNPNLTSKKGREIRVLRVENKILQPQLRFLIQGGVHGNEKLPVEFVNWLANRLAAGVGPLSELAMRENTAFDLIPEVNPDGVSANTRPNSAGVNLNRNFGVLWGLSRESPGPEAFSEPETNGIRELFVLNRYIGAVDIHGYAEWVVAPSSPTAVQGQQEADSVNVKSNINLYLDWMNGLKNLLSLLPGGKYQLVTPAELGDGGAFEDWAFWSKKSFAVCLELRSEDVNERYSRREIGINRPENGGRHTSFLKYELFLSKAFAEATNLSRTRDRNVMVTSTIKRQEKFSN